MTPLLLVRTQLW